MVVTARGSFELSFALVQSEKAAVGGQLLEKERTFEVFPLKRCLAMLDRWLRLRISLNWLKKSNSLDREEAEEDEVIKEKLGYELDDDDSRDELVDA